MVIVFSREDWDTYVAGNRLVIHPGRNEVDDILWAEVKDRVRVKARISCGRWEVSIQGAKADRRPSSPKDTTSKRSSKKPPKEKASKKEADLPEGW